MLIMVLVNKLINNESFVNTLTAKVHSLMQLKQLILMHQELLVVYYVQQVVVCVGI